MILFVGVSLFVDLPIVLAETHMLKYRGEVNFEKQRWDILLHMVFALSLSLYLLIDVWTFIEKTFSDFRIGLFLTPFCFLLGCMVYAPVSFAMVGATHFLEIKLEDFGGLILTEDTKNMMLVLAMIGRIGQILWMVLFCLIGFFILCYCLSKCPDSDSGSSRSSSS